MKRTISQRIALGFGVIIGLLVLVAATAIWSLNRTGRAYDTALQQEEEVSLQALRAQLAVRSANLSYLRFLLEPTAPGNEIQRDSALADARGRLSALRDDNSGDAESRERWSRALELLRQWETFSDRSMAERRGADITAALQARQALNPIRQQLDDVVDQGVADIRERVRQAVSLGRETQDATELALVLAAIIAVGLGALMAYQLGRSVNRALQQSSGVIASAAAEILASATQQAAGANESMAAVSETVATVDEVAQTAEQASQRARAMAESAQRSAEMGREGRRTVDASVSTMAAVRTRVESIADSILALAEQAQAIGEIVTVVNELAEQTNLLALNAAVEATRAGENGRGFAVVAGEIKSLAQESKKSTVQIRQILADIQRATSAAVMATEQGTKEASTGSQQALAAGETIRQLADAIAQGKHDI